MVTVMKSRLLPATKTALPLLRITVTALCAALLTAVQVVLSPITNIELVSLLVILFTLKFRRDVLYCIYIFALLEGLIYGFALWWIMYLYVWTILAGLTWLFRKMEHPLAWASLSGAFGLCFGALCSLPYLFVGGLSMMTAYWIGGIPYDLAHCAGNFTLCLLLFRPLKNALERIPL